MTKLGYISFVTPQDDEIGSKSSDLITMLADILYLTKYVFPKFFHFELNYPPTRKQLNQLYSLTKKDIKDRKVEFPCNDPASLHQYLKKRNVGVHSKEHLLLRDAGELSTSLSLYYFLLASNCKDELVNFVLQTYE